MYSKELLKGTLKTIVLKLLSEQNRMYGYEITQHVKSATEGKVLLTEGALYPTLHKLEAEGFLQTEKTTYAGRVRKYYQLTDRGKDAAKAKVNEFEEFVEAMKLIFSHRLSPGMK